MTRATLLTPVVSDLLVITATPAGDGLVLRLAGEVCVASAPSLRASIERAVDAGERHLVMDLTHVTLLTAAGITELLRGARTIERVGGRLVLAGPSALARRTLERCGLEDRLAPA